LTNTLTDLLFSNVLFYSLSIQYAMLQLDIVPKFRVHM